VNELNSAFKQAVEDYQDHVKKLANRDTSYTMKASMSGLS
jgi:hypothetical protein